MRTYKLTIAYDGTRYQGWQRQANTDQTIQGILESVLSEAAGIPLEVDGSGRTDAGVHAWGQTASVVLPSPAGEEFFLDTVNERLPEDIRIREACLVKNGFHARKSAVGKKYEYRIDTGEKADVFERRYSFHYPCCLDLEAMRRTAGYLTGTHEFAGYTDKKDKSGEKSTKRTIYDIIVSGQGSRVLITYDGTGFLYHMVRILTGTLLEAGTGVRSPESAADALHRKDRQKAGFLAPAQGLCLKEVRY
ncbi:tRNA pseudouridine(38-40) synthase TruA [Lachnoclostridium sp. An169]|uniref:tRNA pseudouridine(38-40) synthase TruA n=1 Tax=Lachnoclostridium sp. An169 TaxID=1965569 RepID=UPI000B39A138|nr:tRNA pseudouridine(38-40) synthase TruA [Lachnoclostridium sp. An169]OUP83407.1 tRNA pseudouridine(38-40) synthase TruA [Lachnoclostridium sp. An169]